MEFLKWVIPYLFLSSFVSLCGAATPQGTLPPSNIHTFDASLSVSEKIPASDLSSFCNVLEYFEIEEDDDNDGDHHYLNSKSSQPLSQLLVSNTKTSVSLFLTEEKVKLFILYHSWKSFLHV